ncbi:hypothetical protein AK830_g5240 [Neonectria ditissima]|uniref:Uncharacterized protein n=1 Tax=Neonectria ditissima TaxID=78410 RepID=A0A0P7AU11_9HYPO|nr:hypothetical protein AK830_g5240 [Neonectria ditissima]
MALEDRSAVKSADIVSADFAPKVAIQQHLGGPHLDIFNRALWNVTSTEIAEITYAQIVDGLPLADVVQDSGNAQVPLPYEHPIYDAHTELCPGALEKTREFRVSFDPSSLQMDATLVADYRASSPGSRAFNTRLVEMVAVAVHSIAVQLYELGPMFHSDDGIAQWVPPKDDIWWEFNEEGAWPTLFRHAWYIDHQQYPHGVADEVGYWAESRIFGGVVVFDRRDPRNCPDAQPDSVWLHPDREEVTYRLFQLFDEQKQDLLDFLTSESPDLKFLPIIGDKKNETREDPEEAIAELGIYRNLWERKPLPEDRADYRLRDVWDGFDHLTKADLHRSQDRAWNRKENRHRQ